MFLENEIHVKLILDKALHTVFLILRQQSAGYTLFTPVVVHCHGFTVLM